MKQQPSKVRRNRKRICFAALIVLAVAGIAYWQFSMRLSPFERRLVGSWRESTFSSTYTLTEDRGWYHRGQRHGGGWYVTGDRLYHPENTLRETWAFMSRLAGNQGPLDDAYVLKFVDDDHVLGLDSANGQSFEWERVKE